MVTRGVPVPPARIDACNKNPARPSGDYVLYWMIAARRTRYNFGLERAVEHARALGKPLVVLEALRSGYRWASDRLHTFAIEGMAHNQRAFASAGAGAGKGVLYYPYVEPEEGAGKGLFEALAARAAFVVTDHYPCFFLPKMVARAASICPVGMERVDGNGLLPVTAPRGQVFSTARAFRYFLQRNLPAHLSQVPLEDPLQGAGLPAISKLPGEITARWPAAGPAILACEPKALTALPIDHSVGRAASRGGEGEAQKVLDRFLRDGLSRYGEERSHPDANVASGLSPYLHYGHLSIHEVFARLIAKEGWTPAKIAEKVNGLKDGFWGMSPTAEAFLDEALTWREVGLNLCEHMPNDYDRWGSLPAWARASLDKHRSDPRKWVYTQAQLEAAETHDAVWNAAQRELVREGKMQNYLRMLWGKKVLEWSRSPEEALSVLIDLNNRYAVDGRDPNSYSGIFWTFGRYDRPWAPERPIFGAIRYMSSDATVKKLRMRDYLARYGA